MPLIFLITVLNLIAINTKCAYRYENAISFQDMVYFKPKFSPLNKQFQPVFDL